ncbi:hypothetical protein [Metabacillus sp. FJAT-53654]|uniref:Uncharacterized protein n=1 Tax=Metabacillus rhizosphaerae TaxID=3117747 RepID=A0ABZ2MPJ3_9BACI
MSRSELWAKERAEKLRYAALRNPFQNTVQIGIRDSRKKKTTDEIITRNKRLREFYDKKRAEGKPFRVAVIA